MWLIVCCSLWYVYIFFTSLIHVCFAQVSDTSHKSQYEKAQDAAAAVADAERKAAEGDEIKKVIVQFKNSEGESAVRNSTTLFSQPFYLCLLGLFH